MEKEFKRVKGLKGIEGHWMKMNRRDGALYRNDDISLMTAGQIPFNG
jgi:hypothetical protein